MNGYRPEIDGLRAIAITSVVLFHAGGEKLFSGGYIGVDIFFVISGYLITTIIFKGIEKGDFSFARFYARRARRILPALLAMIFFTTIAAFVVFVPSELVAYGKILIHTLLFVANFRLAETPGYFDQSNQDNPLLHMWSLGVEEQFYFLWPAILILMVYLLPIRRVRLVTLALWAASLIAAEVILPIWPRIAFFHLPTRGWELLTGAALALNLIPQITNRRLAELVSAIGVAFMIVPVFLFSRETSVPGLPALLPVLGTAALIHASTNTATITSRALSWKPVVFIGLISYSLYLWHWPIIAFAMYAFSRPLAPAEGFVCILAALPIAALSLRYIEQPFRKRPSTRQEPVAGRRWFRMPMLPRAAYAAVAVTAILIASGSFFQESKGAPWRLSSEVRSLGEKAVRETFDSCSARNRQRKGLLECQFGENSTSVVLWGDSHAEVILPLIVNAYGHGRAYFHAGCIPVVNAQLAALRGAPLSPTCAGNNQWVMSEILRLRPKIVVMASRWSAIELPGHYFVDSSAVLTREGSRDAFDKALKSTVNTLTAAGIKVVLMGQVPAMKQAPYPCIARAKTFGLAECDYFVPRGEAEQLQLHVTQTLSSAANSSQNVFFFRPFSNFCDDARCYSVRNGEIFYFDGDHLTISGALSLADHFRSTVPQSFRPVILASQNLPDR